MSEITEIDPFSKINAWLTTVKNIERRWGLTLVSFLPSVTQEQVESLQNKILNFPCLAGLPDDPNIEFYKASHLHCTHLTLKRSSGWGPVKVRDIVKPGHNLLELFEIIHKNTCRMQPITVNLDTLRMSPDGLGIVLAGKCSDDISIESRRLLLESLNNDLQNSFEVSMRSWDKDSSKFHRFHCRIGFMKRPVKEYKAFIKNLNTLVKQFEPISFTLQSVSLVHHQYRSLRPPHQGEYVFPLGEEIEVTIAVNNFVREINLSK